MTPVLAHARFRTHGTALWKCCAGNRGSSVAVVEVACECVYAPRGSVYLAQKKQAGGMTGTRVCLRRMPEAPASSGQLAGVRAPCTVHVDVLRVYLNVYAYCSRTAVFYRPEYKSSLAMPRSRRVSFPRAGRKARSSAGRKATGPVHSRKIAGRATSANSRTNWTGLRLLSIGPSPRPHKKLVAVFAYGDGRGTKTTHFGAAGYEDFTTHGDEERRRRYVARHQAREHFDDPVTAGALSRWILWNKRSAAASIADYRRRFRL